MTALEEIKKALEGVTVEEWRAEKARTIIHVGGYYKAAEISISANHVHEDYKGCKADYVARQEGMAAYLAAVTPAAITELLSALSAQAQDVRAGELGRAKAVEASKHHAGSAAALRLHVLNERRAALERIEG